MSIFLRNPEIFNSPVLLADSQLFAFKAIDEFYGNYSLSELRHNLWKMQEVCITTDNEQYKQGKERSNLLQQVKDLEKLLEAVSIINKSTKV
jgi:hypothetical protein